LTKTKIFVIIKITKWRKQKVKNALFKIANGRVAGIIVAVIFLGIFAALFIGYNVLQGMLLALVSIVLIGLILYVCPLLVMDFLNYKRAMKKG